MFLSILHIATTEEKSIWDSGDTGAVVDVGAMESEITGCYGGCLVESQIAGSADRPLEVANEATGMGVGSEMHLSWWQQQCCRTWEPGRDCGSHL